MSHVECMSFRCLSLLLGVRPLRSKHRSVCMTDSEHHNISATNYPEIWHLSCIQDLEEAMQGLSRPRFSDDHARSCRWRNRASKTATPRSKEDPPFACASLCESKGKKRMQGRHDKEGHMNSEFPHASGLTVMKGLGVGNQGVHTHMTRTPSGQWRTSSLRELKSLPMAFTNTSVMSSCVQLEN